MGVTVERVGAHQEVDPTWGIGQANDDLVAQVRAGNDAAFEAIYDRYARGVLAFCVQMLGSRDEAEDALQATFVSAYRALRTGDSDIALQPWLYTIARNRCLSELRARRETPQDEEALLDQASFDSPPEQVQRREDIREMFEDMQRLPDDQRAALVLFELGDHSHNEIAVVLGVRADKVKALIFQAREGLSRGRRARNSPCVEIRERLATVRGKILPRSSTRAHIDRCPSCAAFEAEVRNQRGALALILPVALTGELKASVISSALHGGGAAAAGTGTAATAGTGTTATAGTGTAATAGTGTTATAGTGTAASAGTGTAASAGTGTAATAGTGTAATAGTGTAAAGTGTAAAGTGTAAAGTGTAAAAGTGTAAGAAGATGTVGASVGAAGGLAGASTSAMAVGVVASAPAAALATDVAVGGGGAAAAAVVAGSSATAVVTKIALTAAAIVTVAVGASSAPTPKAAPAASSSDPAVTAPAAPAAPAAAPTPDSAPPTISGQPVRGSTLSTSDGTWSGSPTPTLAYQWQDCDPAGANCQPIPGATTSTYSLSAADVGSTVQVTITATNTAGSASATSHLTSVIADTPANKSPPTISGQPVQGSTLSTSDGTWSGSPTPALAYQWQDCDPAGANCQPVPGATASSYTLTPADVGSTVQVTITATNTAGTATAAAPPTAVIADPPANTAQPAISGSAVQGSTLSTTDGTWTGSPTPTLAYQWQDCDSSGASCTPIPGATSSTYTLAATDVGSTVQVTITATNSAGADTAAAPPTAVIADPPANSSPPAIAGAAVQGSTLSTTDGTWRGSPGPTLAYQWQDCDPSGASCTPIPGATSSTYTLTPTDVGSTVQVMVTATNSAGSATASSPPTGVIAVAPANAGPPTISGSTVLGSTLSTSDGTWTGTPTPSLAYQWQDCDPSGAGCAPIPGATSSTYTLTPTDVGETVAVIITATNAAGSVSDSSAPSAVVAAPPANTSPPTITGDALAGSTLSTSDGTWTGTPTPSLAYQWQDCDPSGANCQAIPGATASTYTLSATDVGYTVQVAITATNTAGSATAASAPTDVIAQP